MKSARRQRAGDADPLPLTARKLVGIARRRSACSVPPDPSCVRRAAWHAAIVGETQRRIGSGDDRLDCHAGFAAKRRDPWKIICMWRRNVTYASSPMSAAAIQHFAGRSAAATGEWSGRGLSCTQPDSPNNPSVSPRRYRRTRRPPRATAPLDGNAPFRSRTESSVSGTITSPSTATSGSRPPHAAADVPRRQRSPCIRDSGPRAGTGTRRQRRHIRRLSSDLKQRRRRGG